jgi:phasin protein
MMPTIEKPAKPRARSRKADRRSPKSGQQQVEVRVEPDPVSPMAAKAEVVEAEAVTVDVAPAVAMETIPEIESATETVLSGEVLLPEVHSTAPPVAPLPAIAQAQAIAQAYGEYTQKSWLNGRVMVERLIAMRSFDEAIEIQGEFAKQAYTNFLAQSERISALYGEWVQQFFRPFEKLATEWPRIGR